MADKVKYNESAHAKLTSALTNIKSSFNEIIDELKAVETTVNSDFKGEAASALIATLQNEVSKLNTEKEAWSTVIGNAKSIEAALIHADEQSEIVVKGSSARAIK
jgi:uncharacterized protein YukE